MKEIRSMTYQVLARKYRPQAFAEVVGQDHVTQTLKNALAAGRIHHAYLFCGARGTGKTTVARLLAKALNCAKRDGPEPCGVCPICAQITDGSSLDVQEIDGASNTGVDDVRDLRERVKYLPSAGRYKVYIIDEVHMLSGSAFNALLKTIEEPPAHVVFIFATTEAHKIPATIISRCQRYDFRRIPASAIAATLKRIAESEGVSVEEDAVHLIAREATGSLRDAESLFDQAIAFSSGGIDVGTIKSMLGFLDRKLMFDLMDALISRDASRSLAILDEAFSQGTDLGRFAMDLLELIRHMLVLAECGDERGALDATLDEVAALKRLLAGTSHRVGAAELHQMFSLWYRVAEDVGRAAFPKMLLDVGLVRLCRVGPVKPIEEIVARLNSLTGAPLPARSNAPRPEGAREAARQAPAPQGAKPTFEPVVSALDVDAEKRWGEFMRWLIVERPQVASIFHHGVLIGIDDGMVELSFENPLYADMLSEEERKNQILALFEAFFKRKMRLCVAMSGEPVKEPASKASARKEMMRDALASDIVRQAADILNAQIHEVKVGEEK